MYHDLDIKRVLKEFKTDSNGLSEGEVKERLIKHGPNKLDEDKINYLGIFISQFKSPVIYIMIIAAILSYFIGDAEDFWIIIAIIIVNSIIGFWQEVKAETSAEALRKLTETRSTVIRNGKKIVIPSSDLVPGDIITLSEGDSVAADIRLIETKNLLIDESTLTGESVAVDKDASLVLSKEALPHELKNMALSGTIVVKGIAKGVVVKTGKTTYLATIAEKAVLKSPQSPLTRALDSFMKKYVIFIFAALFFIGVIDYVNGSTTKNIVYTLVALLVSAIPEGLPIVLTLVLAIGSRSLSKKKILVRHLPAVETLGNATVIVSDKTGTITEGKLAVKETYAADEKELKKIAALCNESENGKGDPIDVALANWLGRDYNKIKKENPQTDSFSFDTTLRLMGSTNMSGKKAISYVKGAYDDISIRTKNNTKELKERHDQMAKKGLRVLAFGICENNDFVHSKITIVGLIGFVDPAKHGVKEAVSVAHDAGLRVMMITGDNVLTAKTIAEEVGIWKEGDAILQGNDIEKMSDNELKLALPKITVFARALPEHKYRIVKLLQECNEIVAVTGDGVNDVPALKAADLGIAMGGGTEAAKSAAKMIILDNNLKIIIEAIKKGRIIADNIKKVIYYLLTSCLSQIFLISSSLMMGLPIPLYPIHILWINLVADGVQDKTFPFIKEEGNVMDRKPRKIENLFFDKTQLLKILTSSAIITLVNLILLIYMIKRYDISIVVTTVFTSMVFCQWINGIHAQKEREPFFKNLKSSFTINKYIWLGVFIGLILQFFAVYVMNSWFNTVPLGIEHLAFCLISSLSAFLLIEIVKWAWYLIDMRKHVLYPNGVKS